MARVLRVRADVECGGPVFSGEFDGKLGEWAHAVADRLGRMGEDELRAFPMDKTGRGTGAFAASLHAVTEGPVSRIRGPQIRGVTWAPWLEGITPRNTSTGFGGYHLFRKTRLKLARAARKVGEEEAQRVVDALGGP